MHVEREQAVVKIKSSNAVHGQPNARPGTLGQEGLQSDAARERKPSGMGALQKTSPHIRQHVHQEPPEQRAEP